MSTCCSYDRVSSVALDYQSTLASIKTLFRALPELLTVSQSLLGAIEEHLRLACLLPQAIYDLNRRSCPIIVQQELARLFSRYAVLYRDLQGYTTEVADRLETFGHCDYINKELAKLARFVPGSAIDRETADLSELVRLQETKVPEVLPGDLCRRCGRTVASIFPLTLPGQLAAEVILTDSAYPHLRQYLNPSLQDSTTQSHERCLAGARVSFSKWTAVL